MSDVCPQFNSIGRYTMKREIMTMFHSKKKLYLEIINVVVGRVSLISDNGKSEVLKRSYICIICHYIDAEWKLKERIIWFKTLVHHMMEHALPMRST